MSLIGLELKEVCGKAVAVTSFKEITEYSNIESVFTFTQVQKEEESFREFVERLKKQYPGFID